jgi:hypothetical protein
VSVCYDAAWLAEWIEEDLSTESTAADAKRCKEQQFGDDRCAAAPDSVAASDETAAELKAQSEPDERVERLFAAAPEPEAPMFQFSSGGEPDAKQDAKQERKTVPALSTTPAEPLPEQVKLEPLSVQARQAARALLQGTASDFAQLTADRSIDVLPGGRLVVSGCSALNLHQDAVVRSLRNVK